MKLFAKQNFIFIENIYDSVIRQAETGLYFFFNISLSSSYMSSQNCSVTPFDVAILCSSKLIPTHLNVSFRKCFSEVNKSSLL